MKKLASLIVFVLSSLILFAQQKFIVRGKVELPTNSKLIKLSGQEDVKINSDGTFEIKGELEQPGFEHIKADSSYSNTVWLEEGDYEIVCKEVMLPGRKEKYFRIANLKGPANAELYQSFEKRRAEGFGKMQRENAVYYMDSILSHNNSSPILPQMLRLIQVYVGDQNIKNFIQKTSPDLRKSDDIKMIEGGLKRKDKIAIEKKFEDFSLTDTSGNNSQLSSVTGKKAILLDFWSSGCGPCRAEHPRLKEWYKKYKDKGFEIISISIDTNKKDWLNAIKKDGIEGWINVCDFNGWDAALMKSYYIPYIPFRFLLDENKNIVLVHNSQDSWVQEKDIIELLNK